jgi:peptide/nickel transport system substrate-binding protein
VDAGGGEDRAAYRPAALEAADPGRARPPRAYHADRPKAYRERVGPEGFARAPVGTGPYRFTKMDVSAGVEFERFDDYYEGGPKGRPAIRRITAHHLSDAVTELTELLSGRVDWIWNINPEQMENVNRLPTLQAVQKDSMRVGYLQPDAGGAAAPATR